MLDHLQQLVQLSSTQATGGQESLEGGGSSPPMADFHQQYQDYGAEGVPDLVRQFVVYFYRHIR